MGEAKAVDKDDAADGLNDLNAVQRGKWCKPGS